MNPLNEVFAQKVEASILDWAKQRFIEELNSDFQRALTFDAPWSAERLAVLRRQPRERLEILAEVLPLGVFWERPSDVECRNQLPLKQKEAVEKFRADYDQECRTHFSQQVARVARRKDKAMLEEFRLAYRKGNQLIQDIGSRWRWQTLGGGPGEWGLLLERSQLRTSVSFNLGRDMTLSYHISLFDKAGSRSIRFHDDYLAVLGLGAGAWEVGTSSEFPKKLCQVSDFASWHVRQYEAIVASEVKRNQ